MSTNAATGSDATRPGPIAKKLIAKMKKKAHSKVINLEEVLVSRSHAEELHKTVAGQEELSALHPAHAVYVSTQHKLSVMSEQLTGLNEMARFTKLISGAEDEYLPSGPPMSPLTTSYFTCWALFDASVGLAEETLGTTAIAVGGAFGMDEDLLRWMALMQKSRMGVYVHEGTDGEAVVLRELVTETVCSAISPSGYPGQRGELWYVRVLPPPTAGQEHVVFTTPYVLLDPGRSEWQAYFRRTLADAPSNEKTDHYAQHMKFGPARNYWSEFVFEAYVDHRPDVIFLAGLPDVEESRPHSRLNSR